jgi:protein-disulfide isomerase
MSERLEMQERPDETPIARRSARILDHVAGFCVIVLTGAVLYGEFVDSGSRPSLARSRAGDVARLARAEPPLPTEPVSLDGAAVKGHREAPVAIIEYSDFQCPFCARFAIDTLPKIDKRYIATGKVLMAFRHLPLEAIHPFAVDAGASAECAGQQGRFWDMHDRLFQNPRQLDPVTLRRHALSLSLDVAAYDACLTGGAAEKVRADRVGAAAAGVSGTPGFLLGTVESDGRVRVTRRMSGASPLVVFQSAIDSLLAEIGS